ncbi:hypothetical protein HYV82_05970 [Candidatus Woesearchaeota archaeon]|nr:hypothetical protein [Candidatus Woesearchaeota archaeon]
MPNLYRNAGQTRVPDYIRQDFSLADRLTSARNAYIEGLRFVDNKGAQTGRVPVPTSFRGLRLQSTSRFENFFSDEGLGIICYIRPDGRLVDALPYYGPDGTQVESFYYDAGKVLPDDTFKYDGTLRDALTEFEQKGFKFNLARWPIRFSFGGQKSDRTNPDTIWSPRRDYVIVRTNVVIDDIFTSKQQG